MRRGSLCILHAALGCLILLTNATLSPSYAYIRTLSPKGTPVHWKDTPRLNLTGNSRNQSGISEDQFFRAVVLGLQRWQAASANRIQFDYWQGSDGENYPPNGAYNGSSSIYFVSNATDNAPLSPNVLGVTQVWYNSDTGEILETDIVLNDRDFRFTDNPTDTSGYGGEAITQTNGKTNVYIQNVITHEIGHALGLSHSGGLQATMLFMESPEQAHLGCDEQVGIRALYPSDGSNQGDLSGQVVAESGRAVFGAHVLAISHRRGTVLATSISDPEGRFYFKGLEAGLYYLMVEPYFAGPSALPSFYGNLNTNVCPHQTPFLRTFLSDDGFHLNPVEVSPHQTVQAGTLVPQCGEMSSFSLSESLSDPTSMDLDSQFGIVDRLNRSLNRTYRLNSVSGHIEIHALSYSLYSPIHLTLTLMNPDGTAVSAQNYNPVYRGDSGFVDQDSTLIADGLPAGDYLLRVTANRLPAKSYPAGPIALDSSPFLVLIGSFGNEGPVLVRDIPDHPRCRMQEAFPSYSSPSGAPPRASTSQNQKGIGFCGTVSSSNDSTNSSPSLEEILGWLAPWIMMLCLAKILIRLQERSHPANLES